MMSSNLKLLNYRDLTDHPTSVISSWTQCHHLLFKQEIVQVKDILFHDNLYLWSSHDHNIIIPDQKPKSLQNCHCWMYNYSKGLA